MNTFKDKKPTYQFGNEFNAEDMFAALIGYGTPSQTIIDKWRVEEEERLVAFASGKLSHWHGMLLSVASVARACSRRPLRSDGE